jgi:hypothetical protein
VPPQLGTNLNVPAFSGGALQQALQSYLNAPAPEMLITEAPQTVSTLVGNVTVEQTAVTESGRVDDSATPARSGALTTEFADSRVETGSERAQTGRARVIEILHDVVLSNGAATFTSVSTENSFSLTLPEGLVLVPTWSRGTDQAGQSDVKPRPLSLSQVLNAIAEGGSSDGNRASSSGATVEALRMVMADGSPLPDWVVFDPVTKTLSARDIPEGTEPLKVKLQALNGGAVLGEAEITINTNGS